MAAYSYRRYRYRSRGKSGNAGPVIAIAVFAALVASGGAKHPTAPKVHRSEAGVSVARAAPVTSGSEDAFIRATLADLGAPATQANVTSLASWFPHEFPAWPPMAANNPMATTMPAAGSTTYNGVGVQNYPDASEGAQATAQTLDDGYYPGIAAALRSGRGLCGGSLASEFLTWSGNGYSGVC
jgi:hypothetical protein